MNTIEDLNVYGKAISRLLKEIVEYKARLYDIQGQIDFAIEFNEITEMLQLSTKVVEELRAIHRYNTDNLF